MAFHLSFKNVGHYFATGAKYVATGLEDVILFANKAKPLEPEVSLLAGALAGPAASKISDLAFNTLGSVAASLENVQADASAQSGTVGLNLQLDTQTVNDIKAAAAQIDSV